MRKVICESGHEDGSHTIWVCGESEDKLGCVPGWGEIAFEWTPTRLQVRAHHRSWVQLACLAPVLASIQDIGIAPDPDCLRTHLRKLGYLTRDEFVDADTRLAALVGKRANIVRGLGTWSQKVAYAAQILFMESRQDEWLQAELRKLHMAR